LREKFIIIITKSGLLNFLLNFKIKFQKLFDPPIIEVLKISSQL